jgi:hypothetical protein
MAKENLFDSLALDQIKEFARAGTQLLLVLIPWPVSTFLGTEAVLKA